MVEDSCYYWFSLRTGAISYTYRLRVTGLGKNCSLDDTFILCDATQDQLKHLSWSFMCFEAILGLKINLKKSGRQSEKDGRFLVAKQVLRWIIGTWLNFGRIGGVVILHWETFIELFSIATPKDFWVADMWQ